MTIRINVKLKCHEKFLLFLINYEANYRKISHQLLILYHRISILHPSIYIFFIYIYFYILKKEVKDGRTWKNAENEDQSDFNIY